MLANMMFSFRAATPCPIPEMSLEMRRFAELVQALPAQLYNEIVQIAFGAPREEPFEVGESYNRIQCPTSNYMRSFSGNTASLVGIIKIVLATK